MIFSMDPVDAGLSGKYLMGEEGLSQEIHVA